MALSTAQVKILLLALLPKGFTSWFDFSSGSFGDRIVEGAAEQFALRIAANTDVVDANNNPQTLTTVGLVDWEAALGLAGTPTATFGSTSARQAAVISRLREFGASSIPNIQAALAPILGYSPTIIETSRAALTAINAEDFGATIAASSTTTLSIVAGDNAPCSKAGARVVLFFNFPAPADLTWTLVGPDGTTVTWPNTIFGTAAIPSAGYSHTLFGPQFSGKLVDGTWTLSVVNAGAHTGIIAPDSYLIAEGIGRNRFGAEGRAAQIFMWSAKIDESAVGPNYNRAAAIEIASRWNPAHCDGGVALVQTDGGLGALCGDANCVAGLCVFGNS